MENNFKAKKKKKKKTYHAISEFVFRKQLQHVQQHNINLWNLFNIHLADKSKPVYLRSAVDKQLYIKRKCVSLAMLGMGCVVKIMIFSQYLLQVKMFLIVSIYDLVTLLIF